MDTNKSILFIAENDRNFLIRAMLKSLSDAGYHVQVVPPEVYQVTMIEHHADFPKLFIIYLEGSENKYERFYSYIKQLISEPGKGRHLFLIGNPAEITTAYKIIPADCVTQAFQRPVNTEDLLRGLRSVSVEYRLEEEKRNEFIDIDPGRKTILLVDDDIVQLRAMQRWFSKRFNAFAVTSGMEMVAFLKKTPVDLVLLDYEMPVLSGLDAFQMIKSEPATANIPVVFLTAVDDKKTVMSIIAANPAGFFLKTMPPVILVQKVVDFFEHPGDRLADLHKKHSLAPYDPNYVEELGGVDDEPEELYSSGKGAR
ncbi:MAG: response regulator [Treponemataceae bacterium]|nr:response regulator [Treponemataceae bacterium]MDE7392253.1 response regulator [Treponemataceae bacterium]